jgi:hypothetical protein
MRGASAGRALARTRTVDPFLTMEVLYQLSYEGAGRSVATLAATPQIPAGRAVSGEVAGAGFEPAKAEPTDLQSVPFDRSGTPPRARRV